jgi:hypothetical protein
MKVKNMDLSNKTLAFLLVAAIVISIGGTIISLNKLNKITVTGLATQYNTTGTTNFTLQSSVSIIFRVSNVNFGTGYVNANGTGCDITTNATTGWNSTGNCLGGLTNASPFIIENNGNVNVALLLNSSADAAAFIGGTIPAPVFQWAVSNNGTESASCTGVLSDTTWTNVNTTGGPTTVCTNFSYVDSNDTIRLDIKVLIPEDASQSTHTATITAQGSA